MKITVLCELCLLFSCLFSKSNGYSRKCSQEFPSARYHTALDVDGGEGGSRDQPPATAISILIDLFESLISSIFPIRQAPSCLSPYLYKYSLVAVCLNPENVFDITRPTVLYEQWPPKASTLTPLSAPGLDSRQASILQSQSSPSKVLLSIEKLLLPRLQPETVGSQT